MRIYHVCYLNQAKGYSSCLVVAKTILKNTGHYNPRDPQEKISVEERNSSSLSSLSSLIPIQAAEKERVEVRINKKRIKKGEKTRELVEELFAEYLHWQIFPLLHVKQGYSHPS